MDAILVSVLDPRVNMRTSRLRSLLVTSGYHVEIFAPYMEAGNTNVPVRPLGLIVDRGVLTRLEWTIRRNLFRVSMALIWSLMPKFDRRKLSAKCSEIILIPDALKRRLPTIDGLVIVSDFTLLPGIMDLVGERARVLFDSRDLAAEIHSERWFWRRFIQPGLESVSKAFLPECEIVLTPSLWQTKILQDEYRARAKTWLSHPRREAADVDSSSSILRIVYAGKFERNRGILGFLKIFNQSPKNMEIDLFIPGFSVGKFRIWIMSLLNKRIRLRKPVDAESLVSVIRSYDYSFLGFLPANRNLVTALPNKFFESVVAGVPVIAYRGTEMGATISSFELGVTLKPGRLVQPELFKIMLDPKNQSQFRRSLEKYRTHLVEAGEGISFPAGYFDLDRET